MIAAASWSGLPRSLGGGFGAIIEWPVHVPLPDVVGHRFLINEKECAVLRVVRLKRRGKDAARVALVVDEEGGQQ